MNSEITPQFIIPERLGANPLQWIRWEGALEGFSARLFYNEIPKPFIWRYRGRYDIDPEKDLYSFKHGDQLTQSVFGADHKTPEGRKKL